MNKNHCQSTKSIMKPHLGGLATFLLICLFLEQTTARYIYLNADTSLVYTCFRMSEIEEHEFMKGYLTWMKPGLDLDSLTVYNFGYERPLPFPSIALTPNSTLRLNLQTSGLHTQSRSSIAVVGEKYVGKFEEIMLVVDRIHEESQGLPSDIFLQSKMEIELENMSSHDMREEPSLVGILSVIQSSRTHTEANIEF